MKRPADDFTDSQLQHDDSQHTPKKARRFHHSIKFRQLAAVQSLQGAQDEVFFQSQLLRAITLSLSAQGFDSVDSTALEGFRLATETCMFSARCYISM
jgi:transcription initiation factor TFIID subunit 8